MKPIARKDDLVIQEIGDEVLVYDLKSNKAVCLNQTSAIIWKNCDGNKDASEIAHTLEKQLGLSITEDFIWFAFDQLEKEQLLEGKNLSDKFKGINRREVIRNLALTTMVTLPVVAAIVAPQAAHAQSCSAVGQMCTIGGNPTGCCTGLTCGGQPGNGMGTCA